MVSKMKQTSHGTANAVIVGASPTDIFAYFSVFSEKQRYLCSWLKHVSQTKA